MIEAGQNRRLPAVNEGRWAAARPPLKPTARLAWLGVMAIAVASTGDWRMRVGHAFLPGLFTVVCVPLSLLLFALVDQRPRYGSGEWAAVTALIAGHLVLSVPGPSGPPASRSSSRWDSAP